jgi:hypothetical protein
VIEASEQIIKGSWQVDMSTFFQDGQAASMLHIEASAFHEIALEHHRLIRICLPDITIVLDIWFLLSPAIAMALLTISVQAYQ